MDAPEMTADAIAAPAGADPLAARAALADSPDPVPGAPAAGASPALLVDPSLEWVDAAKNFGGMLRELHPITAKEWTDQRLEVFGQALGKCAAHYGWTIGKLLNHPLAGVLVAGMPLAWPLAQPFVTQWIHAQRAKLQPPGAASSPAANDPHGGAKP